MRVSQMTDFRDRQRQEADTAVQAFEEARDRLVSAVGSIRDSVEKALDDPVRRSIGNDQNLIGRTKQLADLGISYLQRADRAIDARRVLDNAEESVEKAVRDHEAARQT